jgi:hypothetical protein
MLSFGIQITDHEFLLGLVATESHDEFEMPKKGNQ